MPYYTLDIGIFLLSRSRLILPERERRNVLTEFVLANKLDSIDFGVVINITKQRLVSRIVPMSYSPYNRHHLVQC